jgi:hypothetical protein
MIYKYLGDLKKYKTLTSTPLQDYLNNNVDLAIEFEDSKSLYSHLKAALMYRKVWTKSWKIMTPDEIMSRSFSKEEEQRKDLYRADLLVILANAFPFYEAAGRQHEYVIKTRKALGKTTWFCTSSLKEMFENTPMKSITTSFSQLIMGQKKVLITVAGTKKLVKQVKNNNRLETNMELGTSVSEVNKDLLDLDNPVWSRITQYR